MSALSSIHFLIIICFYSVSLIESRNLKLNFELDDSLVYLWPLPNEFTYGNSTVSIDPNLKLAVSGIGGNSVIVKEGFERYKSIIFKHRSKLRRSSKDVVYDVSELKIIVNSDNETLNYGVDESYSLFVDKKDGFSIVGEASIEANTVYGALRGLERQTYAKRGLKDESNSNSRVVTPSVVAIETNLVREEAIGVTAMVVHTSQVQSPLPRLLPSVLGTTPQLQAQRDVQPARVCEASQVQANRKVSSDPHMQRASTSNFQLISLGVVTFSQLCTFSYKTKLVEVYKAPWYIQDEPKFAFRGLLLDTSRHYLPIAVIKQVIESMSYAKLNVLHWHIIDEESFPLEVPSYPDLWKGSYSKWERYTVEDAYDIVDFAKMRGINVMAEIDIPGHAESWGTGYPDLWPSRTCREPLDVTKNFTFDVISGILTGETVITFYSLQFLAFSNSRLTIKGDWVVPWSLTCVLVSWVKWVHSPKGCKLLNIVLFAIMWAFAIM
ncbi:hypothetical protein IFM89_023259 [Coptis chinensis]|uniref:Beta-hexosaminidase n=1 Tax=Coptis chinensis TaxID=261450 RepID=A0A835LI85_9MAGN|nr:hypothetical protein IFM89_023259 [Coptis chinensis]